MGFLRIAKACGANHHLHAHGAAHIDVCHRAFGAGEVDQNLAIGQSFADIGLDRYAACLAKKAGSVVTYTEARGDIKSASQLAFRCVAQCLDQHVSHATTGAGNSNLDGVWGMGHGLYRYGKN